MIWPAVAVGAGDTSGSLAALVTGSFRVVGAVVVVTVAVVVALATPTFVLLPLAVRATALWMVGAGLVARTAG